MTGVEVAPTTAPASATTAATTEGNPAAIKRIEVNRYHGRPLALVMVGLPARGKSYIARRICRYINWLGIRTKLFKNAAYRSKAQPGTAFAHNYFDPDNAECVAAREATCKAVLADISTYFKESKGDVAILDAENVTPDRRRLIFDSLRSALDADRIIFIEIVRDEGPYIDNILYQHIICTPSYNGKDLAAAKADYEERIAHYKRVYQPISEDEYAFIRITNDSEGVETQNVRGYLPTRVVNYLCQLNLNLKPIYCSRHGESEYNMLEKLGGDSNLSPEGQKYSAVLKDFVIDLKSKMTGDEDIEIWTSTLKRTRQTVAPLVDMGFKVVHWRALDEINAGVCDGLTYEEVAERMPEEFEKRQKDKYNYRYPKGESYHDLIQRIEPVMMELERVKKVVVIVCHQAVLRCMYAYLMELLPITCVRNEIPLHTVFKIGSSSSGEMSCEKIVLMPHSGKQH